MTCIKKKNKVKIVTIKCQFVMLCNQKIIKTKKIKIFFKMLLTLQNQDANINLAA